MLIDIGLDSRHVSLLMRRPGIKGRTAVERVIRAVARIVGLVTGAANYDRITESRPYRVMERRPQGVPSRFIAAAFGWWLPATPRVGLVAGCRAVRVGAGGGAGCRPVAQLRLARTLERVAKRHLAPIVSAVLAACAVRALDRTGRATGRGGSIASAM